MSQKDGEQYFPKKINIGEQTGTAPLGIESTTTVSNLSVDMVDGKHDGEINALKVKGKEVDDSAIGDNKILVYKTGSGKLEYEAKPAGGGLGTFNIPIYLGDDLFVENKILSGNQDAILTGTIFQLTAPQETNKNTTRGFHPQLLRKAITITAVKYDRKKSADVGSVKYRIYIDKINPEGTITNIWDSTELTISEYLSWSSQSHTGLSLSVAQTDVIRVRVYLKVDNTLGMTDLTGQLRGIRMEATT